MVNSIKDIERNEILNGVQETIHNQNKLVEKQNYELKKIGIQVANVAYHLEEINNSFKGLHLTIKDKKVFIPVKQILLIENKQIQFIDRHCISVDQTYEEIMEELATSY